MILEDLAAEVRPKGFVERALSPIADAWRSVNSVTPMGVKFWTTFTVVAL